MYDEYVAIGCGAVAADVMPKDMEDAMDEGIDDEEVSTPLPDASDLRGLL